MVSENYNRRKDKQAALAITNPTDIIQPTITIPTHLTSLATKSDNFLSTMSLIKSEISPTDESVSSELIIATTFSPSISLIGARLPSNPGVLDMQTCTNGDLPTRHTTSMSPSANFLVTIKSSYPNRRRIQYVDGNDMGQIATLNSNFLSKEIW